MAVINPKTEATQHGNVLLIDPNMVNVNPGMTNSIPQYQDMYIFAELTAKRKMRTVLETSARGTTKIQDNGMIGNDFIVNFIGNNQDSTDANPNHLKFTTNWYDGSTVNKTQFEGFGISNIRVLINSSFIPQVNIEFIDLRGLAFFNQDNSPYRILFDFPPPIFKLKLKGYYGLSLQYELHLVKYTSEFKSETGNYVINAQFVALTYAPLTDVLFRYVVNFPLMPLSTNKNAMIPINPDSETKPKNTYELIIKLKNLYTQYHKNKNTDVDTQVYNNILTQLSSIETTMGILNGYAINPGLKKIGTPQLLVRNMSTVAEGALELTPLNNVGEYDEYIKISPSDGNSDNITQRLYITYLISDETSVSGTTQSSRKNTALTVLNTYRQDELINRTNQTPGVSITAADIPQPSEEGFSNNQKTAPFVPNITNWYVGLDVTTFYVKLYKLRTDLGKQKVNAMLVMNEKINDMVIKSLGMKPTIYNIFKLILDDVDTFFKELKNTADSAENHHKTNFERIIGDMGYADTGKGGQKQIFAFPLIIKDEPVCSQTKKIRTAPIDLNKLLYPDEFPELILVKNFIESFTRQQIITELLNMKGEQNADGTYRWIPISPVDSKLASTSLETPYYGIDTTGGGAGPQPINLSKEKRLTDVFKILLNRFYILTQSSFPYSFYSKESGSMALVEMFAGSESINLASSITNSDYAKLLLTAAEHYGSSEKIQEFYDYVKVNNSDLYSFTPASKEKLKIGIGGESVYVNKKNSQYKGFTMYNGGVVTQDVAGNTNTPISEYQKNTNLGFWKKIKNFGNIYSNVGQIFVNLKKEDSIQKFYKFTEENVFYIPDGDINGTGNNGGVNTKSRFVADSLLAHVESKDNYKEDKLYLRYVSEKTQTITNKVQILDILKNMGNAGFSGSRIDAYPLPNSQKLDIFGDIIEVWVDQLSRHDTEIYSTIINGYDTPPNPNFKAKLSALVLASNFGYTLSPFNAYPYDLNKYVFNTPAVVEVPSYLPYYMGALCDISPADQQEIYNFFVSGPGKNLGSAGAFIFADIYDIKNYLAEIDKTEFKLQFESYYGGFGDETTPFARIIMKLNALYKDAKIAIAGVTNKRDQIDIKRRVYNEGLNPSGNYYPLIIKPLLVNADTSSKNNIINFSQITFAPKTVFNSGYISLENSNADSTKKPINDNYFKLLFKNLVKDIPLQQDKNNKRAEENKKLSGDEDIITQTYYSFKNINDKWLINPETENKNFGYPFNSVKAPNLIDSFVFVDRAMNPIGNTIINPEILIDLLNDPNVSVFTVISQLLSMNGFEFFPLQNFMSFQNNDWKNSFKIDVDGSISPSPTFVCMYIGGSSSYPTGIGMTGQYIDDGITDISVPGIDDFNTSGEDCDVVPDDDDQVSNNEKNKNFKFREVRAFRVRFGEQNQSMFKDIKIDSKEHPETNESIKILSRLAGDNKLQAPPPKGQNLYNLYENRSYKATVTGLGNMMIQPTQYFQLENIPLYNGAYILLSVEHNVEPNKMTTTFSGTKILKYPIPRVLQSSAIVGFDGGNTDLTNPALADAEEVTQGVGTAGNPVQAQYNSMYYFKIQ